MQRILSKMIGRKVDVFFSGAARLRGEIMKVEENVLYLKDEEQRPCYVAIDKIAAIWEANEDEKRAGFFSVPPNDR
ncbi:MAG TPA: MM0924 family protein [Pyrinomonadaceae bacterium]|nr:MM0924 family protein [Pyrinomonadaceae bacterium]